MKNENSPAAKFRMFRERAGLSHEDVAAEFMRISSSCIWDLEAHDDELVDLYSIDEVNRFAKILGVRPVDFFDAPQMEEPLSLENLFLLIKAECNSRNLEIQEFEDLVGWKLREILDKPENASAMMTIAALQWLCRELRVDWRQVLLLFDRTGS